MVRDFFVSTSSYEYCLFYDAPARRRGEALPIPSKHRSVEPTERFGEAGASLQALIIDHQPGDRGVPAVLPSLFFAFIGHNFVIRTHRVTCGQVRPFRRNQRAPAQRSTTREGLRRIGKQKAGSKKNASPPGCGAVGGDGNAGPAPPRPPRDCCEKCLQPPLAGGKLTRLQRHAV
jgi:hypothetical protein